MNFDDQNSYQREYFESVERTRIAPTDTRYVRAHVEALLRFANLKPTDEVLEIGSGLGKFTALLADRGFQITANDLSAQLLARLETELSGQVKTLCCDVRALQNATDQRFDKAIGFFVLHHLTEFPQVFQSLGSVLRPGAQIAFCEPVGVNPLYYLQVLFTPGMRLKGEPSLPAMRPNIILPAMKSAGFMDLDCKPYGYFPPFLKNRDWGHRLEESLERCPFVPWPHAFQVFSGRLPE